MSAELIGNHMGSQMTLLSHLTLSDLKRSNSRSLIFWSLISCKGAELGHMLLLNINHIWGVQWHHHLWPWVTLKGQSQGHSDFEALYLVKELGHMLLWNKQKTAICHTSCRCQAEHQGPWTSCVVLLDCQQSWWILLGNVSRAHEIEICPLSIDQLQVSSRAPRSMDFLF